MTRATLKLTLCICVLGIGACNSNDSADSKKLRDELEASKAENARLKAELETLKSGTEEEFTDGGDFSRVNGGGKIDFSYKKVYARPPELVIETPKAPPGFSFGYEVTERRLDGFTVESKGRIGSKEELAEYLKNMKWRVKGMIPRTAK